MPPHESKWVLRRHFVILFKAKGVQAFLHHNPMAMPPREAPRQFGLIFGI